MEDERKTKKQLIQELHELRQSVTEVENLKEESKQTRVNQEKFTKAFRQNSIPMTIATVKDGRFVDVSDAFLRLVERKRDEVIGYTSRKTGFITEEQRSFFYNELSKNGRIENLEMEVQPKGIGVRYGLFNVVMISFNNENYLLTTIQNITDRKLIEKTLRESEAQKNAILNGIATNIAFVDKDLRILWVNKKAAESVNKSLDEMTGHTCHEFWADPSKPCKDCPTLRAFQTQKPEHTILHTPDGRIWDERGEPIFDTEGNLIGVVEIAQDITERKQVEKALQESEKRYRELSIVDSLTTLYNSRHFYVQLKIELERSNRYEQPLTLLLLDLDDFKLFNDTYGHIEGDQVLQRLGHVIKRCLRETDHAYRYGGEEFTILLPMTTSADGAVTAERIRTEFKKEIFSPAPGQEAHLTISIGLAQYKPKEDMKAFVHRVDQLMYQAKKNGKDKVCSEL